jgi:hypothetical protein
LDRKHSVRLEIHSRASRELWSSAAFVPIMFRMSEIDPSFRDALAYALWRSPWRTRLGGLDACRLAAADMVRHLRRAGYDVRAGEPAAPHGGLARGAPDPSDTER